MDVLHSCCSPALPHVCMITGSLSNFTTDRRVWLLLLTVLLALILGCRAIADKLALTLVSKAGFWFVLATFLIWLRALWQTFAADLRDTKLKSADWTSALIVIVAGI